MPVSIPELRLSATAGCTFLSGALLSGYPRFASHIAIHPHSSDSVVRGELHFEDTNTPHGVMTTLHVVMTPNTPTISQGSSRVFGSVVPPLLFLELCRLLRTVRGARCSGKEKQ